MNMISTGAFLNEMDASNKQPSLAEKFAAVWEKKNAKAARAGGVSLMALSLAACGSSSDDTTSSTDTSTSTDTTTVTPTVQAFTTGLDTLTGTSGDDSFTGLQSGSTTETANASDSVDGGAGVDTLTIINSDGAAFNGLAVSNIENMVYRSSAASGDLDADDISGVTSLTLDRTVGANDVTDLSLSTLVTFTGSNEDMDTTLTWKAAGVTGTADSTTVTVDGVEDGADIELSGNIETVNIVASGSASRMNDLVLDADTTTLTVDAAVDLRVDTTLTAAGVTSATFTGAGDVRFDAALAAATTVDGSAATGDLTLDIGTVNATVTGGSGDDTFDFAGGLTKSDTIDGGDGADKIVILPGAAITGDLAISNVETLSIGNVTGSYVVDLDNVAGLTTIELTAGTASNVTTLRDVATTVATINYVGAKTTAAQAFDTVVMDYDSTTDINSLTVNIGNGGVASTGSFSVNTGSEFDGADNVTINITDAGTGTGDNVNLNTINADSANAITINSNTDISLTIAGMGGAAAADRLADIDMSGSDAGITLTVSSDDDAEVRLGDGDDDFNGGAGDETIYAGTGNDTVEGDAGNDTIYLGASDGSSDKVVVEFGGEGEDTVYNFEAGAGGDVIDLDGTNNISDVSDATSGDANSVLDTTGFGYITGNAEFTKALTVVDNGEVGSAASLSDADVEAYLKDFDLTGTGTADATMTDTGEVFYIVVSDGVDSGLFMVSDATTDATGTADIVAADLTLMLTLDGITDTGTLTADNFADFV